MNSGAAVAIGLILSAIGFSYVVISVLGSKKKVVAWASNTGNHEVLVVFYLAAIGLSYVLKKLDRKK